MQTHLCLNTQSASFLFSLLSSPSLTASLSLLFALSESSSANIHIHTLTRVSTRGAFMRAALRAPRGFAPRFMRVRATTLVRALKFISVPRARARLSLSLASRLFSPSPSLSARRRYLYVREAPRELQIGIGRYFLVLSFSLPSYPFSSS